MSEYNELIYTTKRQDNLTKLRKQTAANALQQYSLLAIKSLNDCKSPARTRLQLMRVLTDLPTDASNDPYNTNIRKKSSSSSGYTSR